MSGGLGGELLYGTNKYEYTGLNTGNSSTYGAEAKAFVEGALPIGNKLEAIADVGVALTYLSSAAGSPAAGPVSSSYTVGFPEIYASVGGAYALDKNASIAANYRFTLASLGAWTDTFFVSGMYEVETTASAFYLSYIKKF